MWGLPPSVRLFVATALINGFRRPMRRMAREGAHWGLRAARSSHFRGRHGWVASCRCVACRGSTQGAWESAR